MSASHSPPEYKSSGAGGSVHDTGMRGAERALATELLASLLASGTVMLPGSLGGAVLLRVGMSSEGWAIGRTQELNQSARGRGELSTSMATRGVEEMANGSCRHGGDNPGCCAGSPGRCVGTAGASGARGGAAVVRSVQVHPAPMVGGLWPRYHGALALRG